MNKWQAWYDSLPMHTKASLNNQAIWRDIDLIKFTAITFIAGIILGYVL